jgi:hypothetical protein
VTTHGTALNALDRVFVLMAKKAFVMTATKRLISQKLSTTRQMMKKKQETKNSDWITAYINVDHCHTNASATAAV